MKQMKSFMQVLMHLACQAGGMIRTMFRGGLQSGTEPRVVQVLVGCPLDELELLDVLRAQPSARGRTRTASYKR